MRRSNGGEKLATIDTFLDGLAHGCAFINAAARWMACRTR
jgi:hypothetical protein